MGQQHPVSVSVASATALECAAISVLPLRALTCERLRLPGARVAALPRLFGKRRGRHVAGDGARPGRNLIGSIPWSADHANVLLARNRVAPSAGPADQIYGHPKTMAAAHLCSV